MQYKYGILVFALMPFFVMAMSQNVRFHLKNKPFDSKSDSKKALRVTLYKDANAQDELEIIQSAHEDVISDNNSKVNQIQSMKIEYCDDNKMCRTPENYITVRFDRGSIAADKATYYLKFYTKKDGAPVVEPQRGLFGKTEDGHSLKNNVKVKLIDSEFTARD